MRQSISIYQGNIQFNNTQSEELARQLGILSLSTNSAFGMGENLTLFGIARPTLKGMKGTKEDVSIRGGGISLSSIIGNDGLKASLSYTETMTRPGAMSDRYLFGIKYEVWQLFSLISTVTYGT